MAIQYSVPLKKIIQNLNLEVVYYPEDVGEVMIHSSDINRPGLQLVGFFDFFDPSRIQLMGRSEMAYFNTMCRERQDQSMKDLLSRRPAALIFTRGMHPNAFTVEQAELNRVPLLMAADTTSNVHSALNSLLNVDLAPRVTRHGVLVEVHGEGVLIIGDSGVGKSETAMELVKRGHRLIADDAVDIRRVNRKTLIGCAPSNIRHFLELRGIGIINVRRVYGFGAVKDSQTVDLVIYLEQWDKTQVYDRMGIEDEYTDILGLKVPSLTIPVKPGRNLAIIVEVAAINNRLKRDGYNAARDLIERLGVVEETVLSGAEGEVDDEKLRLD